MISIESALSTIMEKTTILDCEKRDIVSCLNKVLAVDIYSNDNLPPFDKSAMDGYAIKSEDTVNCSEENPISLKIKGVIKAGDYYEDKLSNNEALKIMTGAPLPYGADAIIEIEKVKVENDNLIISDFVKVDNHIIKMGEETKIGDLALTKGQVIRPAEIGFLASLGYSEIAVNKSPTVALVITGDELVDINEKLEKGKIRNSNEYSLKALIENVGANVLSLGIVCDDKDILKEKVKYAMENADIVITSGGASVGDYDFVEDVLKELGATLHFDKVSIKPGKPLTFATLNEKLFFGLPGNPMALITTFEEFIKPAIKKMMGYSDCIENTFPVVLGTDFKAKKGRTKLLYAQIKKENEKYYAYDVGSQCSNHLMTMSKANGIIIIPEDCGFMKAGEIVNGKYIFK